MSQINKTLRARLHGVIPGGAHTYSRGDDQFPSNAPPLLERAVGCFAWGPSGDKFLDFGMGLRSVTLGYGEPSIVDAVIAAVKNGNNLTRASRIELEAAELFVDIIDSAEMVKFCKNGSNATSAAIKLARGYTGRTLVARCIDHPFFSFDDWFIASTEMDLGTSGSDKKNTVKFKYNDLASLQQLIDQYPNEIACVIMEPAATHCPHPLDCATCDTSCEHSAVNAPTDNFLSEVQALCQRAGILFILDEMITGFRWHLKGAQHVFGISPDLTTFGKAMGNGVSIAAIAGKREIMELGSIDRPGQERLFLLSSTHGAEMTGMAAFLATVKYYQDHNVVSRLWRVGDRIKKIINEELKTFHLDKYFSVLGPSVQPYVLYKGADALENQSLRTLFAQELIENKIMMPWISPCIAHEGEALEILKISLKPALARVAEGVTKNINDYIDGPLLRPVFRKYN